MDISAGRMQHTTDFSWAEPVPDPLRQIARRRLVEVLGLLLLAGSLALSLALVSWSVRDPSLNHATDGPVHNFMGAGGAIIADLMMQMVGVGSIAILVPPAFWAWRLITEHKLERIKLRLLFWLMGGICAAVFAALLPVTDRWPLPTGLGGVAGDALLSLPLHLAGDNGMIRVLCGLTALAFMILLLTASSGFGLQQSAAQEPFVPEYIGPRGGKKPRSAKPSQNVHEDEDEDADEPGLGLILMGGFLHFLLGTKAMLVRFFQPRPLKLPTPRTPAQNMADAGRAAEAAATAPVSPPAPTAIRGGRREPTITMPMPSAAPPVAISPTVSVGPVPPPSPPQQHVRMHPASMDAPFLEPEPFDASAFAPPHLRKGAKALAEEFSIPPLAIPPIAMAAPQAASRIQIEAAAPAPKPASGIKASDYTRQGTSKDLSRQWQFPALDLLSEAKKQPGVQISADSLEQNARLLEGVLDDFNVKGDIIHVRPGPVVTLYELEPAPGVKSSRVIGLADDIARSMSALSARVAVVQGRNAIGIELPNQKRETVYLRELVASQDFVSAKHRLAIALGKTIGGEPVIVDLAKMPHLLVAGTTGSGKSVAINTMILSLLYRLKPEECRLIMVDPKMLELSVYDGIPHLLTPVVTDPKKAVIALKWAVREMEDRYKKMSKLGVRNIDGFNARVAEAREKGESVMRLVQTGFDRETGEPTYAQEAMDLKALPFIVVIVDEMADLMMVAGKDIEGAIQRLAQMARAAGIHLIMATQRPSVDVITGTIKANFPTRISFQVTSKIDSRTILGEQGAEQLLGQGDMLHMAGGGRISRVHGPFVSDAEVEKIVAHLKTQGQPEYLDAITSEDEPADEAEGEGEALANPGSMDAEESGDMYDRAVNIVLRDRKCSTSYIQRRLSVGYNKAASLVERMQREGVVGPANHAGKREILVGGGIDRGAHDLSEDE